ncbi:hypothetical protein M407DRAFT_216576 [Tulasnella calospora MUT 4182]|uniref:BTB domain-containing protein n=1 Tax=Tulasnella calospora MUT 4182 TaxID=1051891 RepID=A0A0C3KM05_9AGAM|nr:hypothetical protein M407DRAFT_216576 [Tulasnella calospora MUT 4182]
MEYLRMQISKGWEILDKAAKQGGSTQSVDLYLPRGNGNVKRSAALVPLSFCMSRYPDQLKPLDGLFGFSSKQEEYNGAKNSNLSKKHFDAMDIADIINRFYAYASQSLFFTKSITEIAAIRRTRDLKTSPVWFVTSSRETMSQGAQDVVATNLSLKVKGPHTDAVSEHWLVTRSQASKEGFPTHLQPLFPLHRLPTPTFGLAVHLSAKSTIRSSRLFATLPLPVSISLPVHVHATWILAQDRRSIRYDAPDAGNQRPLDTQYNEHILETAIAPLYIKTLALVLAHHPKVIRLFWPDKAPSGPSRIIATKLYTQIISTQEPVLLSAQKKPIAPSNAVIQLPTTPLAEKQSLVGIPLLLRGDRTLVEFQNAGQLKVFASHRVNLAKLFGHGVVVSSEISEAFAENLVKQNLNVVSLNPQGMRDLLAQHSEAIISADTKATTGDLYNWHKDLLKFLTLPTCPVRIEDLADLPLLPVVGREMVVSLNYTRSGGIWWRSQSENRALTNVLLQLDVISVDDLPGELQRTTTNDLLRILQLFEKLNLSPEEILRMVAPGDWAAFAAYLKAWFTPYHLADLLATDFQTLNKLPIFEGRQGTRLLSFVPASQVVMLPDSVPLETVAGYLPPGTTFATASPELNAILRKSQGKNRNLTLPNLFKRLRIPTHLTPDDETSFLSLVDLVATHHTGHYDSEIIPDGNRVLRRPSELFDHRVEVFSSAFESRPDLFVHPSFRNMIDRLVYLGVNREVTSQRLIECIRAVDHDAQEGQEVRARFTMFPSPHLKAVYPNIGEPTAANVVQHLVSLINHVAPNWHQSSIVLIDIRSVYTWLQNQNHAIKAQLRSLSKLPLWLNIDSVEDNWIWRSADELVFDITHDAGGHFVVRNFLDPDYRSLLLDVGAHEYQVASLPPQATSKTEIPHPEMMRSGWNELRRTGQLLDICFQVQGQEIQAHRGMLAAMVPHFKTAFGGSFRESIVMTEDTDLPVYPLPEDEAVSAFAVQCVVVLARAEASQVELLIEICRKTKKQNQWI